MPGAFEAADMFRGVSPKKTDCREQAEGMRTLGHTRNGILNKHPRDSSEDELSMDVREQPRAKMAKMLNPEMSMLGQKALNRTMRGDIRPTKFANVATNLPTVSEAEDIIGTGLRVTAAFSNKACIPISGDVIQSGKPVRVLRLGLSTILRPWHPRRGQDEKDAEWLRVNLAKIREVEYNKESSIVWIKRSITANNSPELLLKLSDAEEAQRLVSWAKKGLTAKGLAANYTCREITM